MDKGLAQTAQSLALESWKPEIEYELELEDEYDCKIAERKRSFNIQSFEDPRSERENLLAGSLLLAPSLSHIRPRARTRTRNLSA